MLLKVECRSLHSLECSWEVSIIEGDARKVKPLSEALSKEAARRIWQCKMSSGAKKKICTEVDVKAEFHMCLLVAS